jgi:hypothetical protein
MISKYFGLLVLILLVAHNAGLIGYYYPILPARVGLYEFDEGGPSAEPTVWMAKGWFATLLVAAFVLIPLVMMAVEWLCAKLCKQSINIPNRDYWFAPERRADTEARMFSAMLWLANAAELLTTAVLLIVFRTTMGHPEVLRRTPFYLLACFLTFVAAWIIYHYARFKRVPPQ